MHINCWQEVKKDSFGKTGLLLFLLLIMLAVLAPLITNFKPTTHTGFIFNPPNARFWLGTNDVGQDIWTQLIYGARTSLIVGCGTSLLSVLFSILVGGTAALFGGLYDRITMRIVDSFIIIPPVMVVILAAAYLKPNLFSLILLLSLLIWPGGARVVRSQTLLLKQKMHVQAANTFGADMKHIMLRHIVPDLAPILIALIIQDARRAIFMEAGLSFLGIADPSMISWGIMIQQALKYSYLEVWKWWLIPSGFALSLTILSLTFIGSALEKCFNPRLLNEKKSLMPLHEE